MEPVKYILPQEMDIIQVFRHINIYDKSQKSFEDRREDNQWRKNILSGSGFIKDAELFLPESITGIEKFTAANFLTLEDDNNTASQTPNRAFNFVNIIPFDIFRFIKNETNIELHMQHSYFGVGIPERPNIKLCDIKLNKPVEIKVNGKTESSMSSRRAREFKEQQYIFTYLGKYKSCILLPEKEIMIIKKIPAKRKLIDLLKPLW